MPEHSNATRGGLAPAFGDTVISHCHRRDLDPCIQLRVQVRGLRLKRLRVTRFCRRVRLLRLELERFPQVSDNAIWNPERDACELREARVGLVAFRMRPRCFVHLP